MVKRKVQEIIELMVLFFLPVVFIYFGIIPIEYRFYVILIGMFAVLGIVLFEKWSLKKLGIRMDNLKENLFFYLLISIGLIVGTIAVAQMAGGRVASSLSHPRFLYGFFVLSFFQEFIFRSFLIPRLKELFRSPSLVIMVDGLLFGLIHIIFPNALMVFVLSSLLGTIYAWIYYYRPNLILITLSHAAVNFMAVYYCLVNISVRCM